MSSSPSNDAHRIAGEVLDSCRADSDSDSAVSGPPGAAAAFSFADIDVAKVFQVIKVIFDAITPLIQGGGPKA